MRDRDLAVLEKMARDAKASRAPERGAEEAARVLAECIQQGLGWAEIKKRLADLKR